MYNHSVREFSLTNLPYDACNLYDRNIDMTPLIKRKNISLGRRLRKTPTKALII